MSLLKRIGDVLAEKPSAKAKEIAELIGESEKRVAGGLKELAAVAKTEKAKAKKEG